MKKPELIEDWRKCWRFWSVRLGVMGSAITAVLIAFPDVALSAWAMLPADLKAAIPERYMPLIGVGIFVASLIARAIKQTKLEDLNPVVEEKARDFLALCKAEGIEVIVTSTYRDAESQSALYAKGRTAPGKKVTNAKAGQSWHNWRVAFDVVPLRNGKPVWGTTGEDLKLWQRIGAIGKSCGLEWAGDWRTFREFPHFQFTGGLSLADFQAGRTLQG